MSNDEFQSKTNSDTESSDESSCSDDSDRDESDENSSKSSNEGSKSQFEEKDIDVEIYDVMKQILQYVDEVNDRLTYIQTQVEFLTKLFEKKE